METRRIVYILRSKIDPNRHYVGLTSTVEARLAWHNAGLNRHTARHRPWRLVVFMEFDDQITAARFECYLKTHGFDPGYKFAVVHAFEVVCDQDAVSLLGALFGPGRNLTDRVVRALVQSAATNLEKRSYAQWTHLWARQELSRREA